MVTPILKMISQQELNMLVFNNFTPKYMLKMSI